MRARAPRQPRPQRRRLDRRLDPPRRRGMSVVRRVSPTAPCSPSGRASARRRRRRQGCRWPATGPRTSREPDRPRSRPASADAGARQAVTASLASRLRAPVRGRPRSRGARRRAARCATRTSSRGLGYCPFLHPDRTPVPGLRWPACDQGPAPRPRRRRRPCSQRVCRADRLPWRPSPSRRVAVAAARGRHPGWLRQFVDGRRPGLVRGSAWPSGCCGCCPVCPNSRP